MLSEHSEKHILIIRDALRDGLSEENQRGVADVKDVLSFSASMELIMIIKLSRGDEAE